MSAIKWALVCGVMNAAGMMTVFILAALSDLSESSALLIGALCVVASLYPFEMAVRAYEREGNNENHR